MLIPVMLRDGSIESVSPQGLENLIASDQLLCFKRSCGWVAMGQGQVRGWGDGNWEGSERRRAPYRPWLPYLVP